MNLHSASGLRRKEWCPASAHLPETRTVHTDATAGNEAHAERERNESRPGFRAEVAFAYNAITGEARELPKAGHREYPTLPGPGWVFGQTDTIGLPPDGPLVIEDFKSGVGYQVEPPAINLQLGFYAVAASIVHGRDSAVVRVVYGDGRTTEHTHDGMALMALEERIRRVVERAAASEASGNPVVVEGDHCWRCPCYARCPAKTSLAIGMSEGVDLRNFPSLELTPESVARGWVALKAAKKVLGEVERIYRGFAAGEPVALPDGKTLGTVEKSRESIDGHKAYAVLSEAYGESVALQACEVEATKASIERAVKPLAEKGKGAALVREALQKIEQAGGISVKHSTAVEER